MSSSEHLACRSITCTSSKTESLHSKQKLLSLITAHLVQHNCKCPVVLFILPKNFIFVLFLYLSCSMLKFVLKLLYHYKTAKSKWWVRVSTPSVLDGINGVVDFLLYNQFFTISLIREQCILTDLFKFTSCVSGTVSLHCLACLDRYC